MAATTEYAIAGMAPRTAARPESGAEVAALLKSAADAGEAVVAWGAGTKQGMGNPPRAYDLALDVTGLDGVVEYEPADLVVTAQAGTPLAALQRRLGEAGQFLALDPPFHERATLGGTLATNVSGPSRLLYGTARDLVLGMRVATPQGELVKSGGKVVKNVVGYDLNKMHIGGLGTLGIMVEVTFKVHPLPRAEATVAAEFESLETAHEVAGRLFRSVLYPRAVELVRGRLGNLPETRSWGVLMWAAGSPATVERQVRDASGWCNEAGAHSVSRLHGGAHRGLWRSVQEFGRYDSREVSGESREGALLKLTCLPTDVARLCNTVEAQSRAMAGAAPEILAHAGSGVVYISLAPVTAELLADLTGAARALGGAGVIEQRPRELHRTVDPWGPPRDDLKLMQALKEQFDPTGTLSPGRFIGGI
jgi:glycolate oxidase FAD binding subunit